MKYTIEKVKDELPSITVNWNGKLTQGVVCGRNNQFATVRSFDGAVSWEFSWATIVRALNDGRALIV